MGGFRMDTQEAGTVTYYGRMSGGHSPHGLVYNSFNFATCLKNI